MCACWPVCPHAHRTSSPVLFSYAPAVENMRERNARAEWAVAFLFATNCTLNIYLHPHALDLT